MNPEFGFALKSYDFFQINPETVIRVINNYTGEHKLFNNPKEVDDYIKSKVFYVVHKEMYIYAVNHGQRILSGTLVASFNDKKLAEIACKAMNESTQ